MAYPNTTWTDADNDPAAPGCELKLASGAGQDWTIDDVFDWICRITVNIEDMGDGPDYTQTP